MSPFSPDLLCSALLCSVLSCPVWHCLLLLLFHLSLFDAVLSGVADDCRCCRLSPCFGFVPPHFHVNRRLVEVVCNVILSLHSFFALLKIREEKKVDLSVITLCQIHIHTLAFSLFQSLSLRCSMQTVGVASVWVRVLWKVVAALHWVVPKNYFLLLDCF